MILEPCVGWYWLFFVHYPYSTPFRCLMLIHTLYVHMLKITYIVTSSTGNSLFSGNINLCNIVALTTSSNHQFVSRENRNHERSKLLGVSIKILLLSDASLRFCSVCWDAMRSAFMFLFVPVVSYCFSFTPSLAIAPNTVCGQAHLVPIFSQFVWNLNFWIKLMTFNFSAKCSALNLWLKIKYEMILKLMFWLQFYNQSLILISGL